MSEMVLHKVQIGYASGRIPAYHLVAAPASWKPGSEYALTICSIEGRPSRPAANATICKRCEVVVAAKARRQMKSEAKA